MISTRFRKIFLGTVLLVGTGLVVFVGLDNHRLKERVATLRSQTQQATQLREANQHGRTLLTRIQAADDGGARAIHAELEHARAKVDDLERHALETWQKMRSQAQVDAVSLADNRDPEKGLTRLENYQDVGADTPAAAFQTFVWAALKGEDGQLAEMIAWEGEAQARASAVVAALPETVRAQYDTPEKLAALFFASLLTAQPSAQIVDTKLAGPQHATVSVRGLTEKIQRVPMQLGAQGWQIVVPPGMAEKIGQWALGRKDPAGR